MLCSPAQAWDRGALEAYKPTRESTLSLGDQGPAGVGQPLELALKRYALPGAQPILLLPGIASNDRVWDATVVEYSLARRLRQAGFDVWMGNYRHTGTPGFRSESPELPYHWTVEDQAIYDLPALVEKVRISTGQRPFVAGHSLSAWILDGYLSGLHYLPDGSVRADRMLSRARQAGLKGVISVAGVYSVWWPKSLRNVVTDPVLTKDDYYRSNYELEAMALSGAHAEAGGQLPSLPLSWIGSVLALPLDRIPFVGPVLARLYRSFQGSVIQTPLLSMFYVPSNAPTEVVRTHGIDGLEELGPRLIEQLGNAVVERRTASHYHGEIPADAHLYAPQRAWLKLPLLFVAGAQDRCANADMIHDDGYLLSGSADKQYWRVTGGHLDVISGKRSEVELLAPLVAWLRARQ
ncbi:MAG: hypothetical protein IT285_02620 [Bdellovibrionales bacterium]|nr:hypothetical protein [Bdellovibrionales bacterium]